jgi:hypothetical protein
MTQIKILFAIRLNQSVKRCIFTQVLLNRKSGRFIANDQVMILEEYVFSNGNQ